MENSPELRAEFVKIRDGYPHHKLYYIDECGIDKYLYREHAYSLRGVVAEGKISGRKFKRINVVAAKCGDEIVAPMIYDGTTDSILFEYWFQNSLLKSVPKGSVFVLDNATFHRKQRLRELAASAGCVILFLPPYSPDLNPIEKYWAWLKRKLREILPSFVCFEDALDNCFQFK